MLLTLPRIPLWIFIFPVILYFSAARLDVMDIDASQYAEISREMLHQSNWLEIYDRGADYLDKPPFLFWVSALSMKIFGVNNFGYRFPSIMFALLALFSVYRLGRALYADENTGRLAALIFATSQALFLWTNDVRTDTILMGAVITGIWLIYEWTQKQNLAFLFGGCVLLAIGMMTKGPIALMTPIFSFGMHWALHRKWSFFVQPVYLLGLLAIGLLLVPMSVGLYQQFDLHPEKFVNGTYGLSGLRFFYWSQSFGRITGESPWNNGAPFTFLLENMLWAFIPWTLLFAASLVTAIATILKQRFRLAAGQEWLTTGGFLLTYLSLATSKYQLPHYLFIVYPHAALMVAGFLQSCAKGAYPILFKLLKPIQTGVAFAVLIVSSLTFLFVFKPQMWICFFWIVGLCVWLVLAFWKPMKPKYLWLSATSMIVANVVMTHHFYYELFQYQAGSLVGRFVRQRNLPASRTLIYQLDDPLNSLPFYARRVIGSAAHIEDVKVQKPAYLIIGEPGLDTLNKQNLDYQILTEGEFFKVSELTPTFLNPKTRARSLRKFYVVRLK